MDSVGPCVCYFVCDDFFCGVAQMSSFPLRIFVSSVEYHYELLVHP